jgi:hypothetical protein
MQAAAQGATEDAPFQPQPELRQHIRQQPVGPSSGTAQVTSHSCLLSRAAELTPVWMYILPVCSLLIIASQLHTLHSAALLSRPRNFAAGNFYGVVQRSSKVSRPRGQLDLHAMSVPTARVAILRVRCASLSHRYQTAPDKCIGYPCGWSRQYSCRKAGMRRISSIRCHTAAIEV